MESIVVCEWELVCIISRIRHELLVSFGLPEVMVTGEIQLEKAELARKLR